MVLANLEPDAHLVVFAILRATNMVVGEKEEDGTLKEIHFANSEFILMSTFPGTRARAVSYYGL